MGTFTTSDLYDAQRENREIRAAVSEAQSELNKIERENDRLRNEISSMVSAIRGSRDDIEKILTDSINRLENDRVSVHNSHVTLENAYNIHISTEQEYALFKNVEEAYKSIRQINNKIKYEMAEHESLRKIASAMVDNLSSHTVSMESLRTQAEKVFLKSGNLQGLKKGEIGGSKVADFWLAFAMLYIFYDYANETEAGVRAIEQAKEIDATSTYTFLFMYYMCAKDFAKATNWFDKIPDKKSLFANEKIMLYLFLVKSASEYRTGYAVLDSKLVALWDEFFGGKVSDASHIVQKILKWYYASTVCKYYEENEGHDKKITEFSDVLQNPKPLIDSITDSEKSFKVIKEHVSEYKDMMLSLAIANENEKINNLIGIYEYGENRNYYGNYVSYMVDEFIKSSSTKALDEYKAQIEEYEAVIACKGDKAKAKTYLFAQKAEKEKSSSVDYMYRWLNEEEEEYAMKDRIKKASFIALRKYYLQAYKLFRKSYLDILPKKYKIKINDFETDTDFSNQEADEKKVKRFYEHKAEMLKAAISKWQIIVFPILAALLTGGGVYLMIDKIGPGSGMLFGMACFVAAAVAIFGTLFKMRKNKRKATEIDIKIEEEYRLTLNELKKVYSEYKENFKKKFSSTEEYSKEIQDNLSK